MFYYLNGIVAAIEPNLAVIDCGGVGYACATTNYTLSQLKKGERAKLYLTAGTKSRNQTFGRGRCSCFYPGHSRASL